MSTYDPCIQFACIGTEEVRYADSVALRLLVLRQPLGLTWQPHDLTDEPLQTHIVALHPQAGVIGTVVLKPLAANLVKLRQMAIHPDWQGQGLGKQLVAYAVKQAQAMGATAMVCDARATAITFYEGLGFVQQGEGFLQLGLPHVAMRKHL